MGNSVLWIRNDFRFHDNTLTSDYATEYRLYAQKAIIYMDSKQEKELLNLISREASKSLRRE